MSYLIGIDTGGTFTDSVIINEETGAMTFGKSPSTPRNFSAGIIASIENGAESLRMSLKDVLGETRLLCHGSTVALNTMINRSGARTGLVTTKGFEDTLLIMRGRGRWDGLSEEEIARMVATNKPPAIIPRALIQGVTERVDYKGEVIVPLDHEEAKGAIERLFSERVESIAVSLLWSFRNPAHEQEIKRIITEIHPEIPVTLSSELAPVLGEFERTSTVAVNSYLTPPVNAHLTALDDRLTREGFTGSLLVMQGYGGCLPLKKAMETAVTSLGSGPAGGAIASKYMAATLGYGNVITTDVGGTSFDVSIVREGKVEYAVEASTSRYRILTPMLYIRSIGAGGGSIGWLDPISNTPRVGPISAGADPGPICYDMGGTEPTLTDVNLILGYLNPDYFLGGRMKLNVRKAHQGLKEKIAKPLGMGVIEAAAGLYNIANANMTDLIRVSTIGRGYDPREFILFAYGGAGPVHAGVYGAELGVAKVVVPVTASVHSAMGMLASDIIHIYELFDVQPVPANPDQVSQDFETLEIKAIEDLRTEGFKDEDIAISRYVDMRYGRQVHELRTPVPGGKPTSESLAQVADDFERIYEAHYGKGAAYREAGMLMVTFRVEAIGKIMTPALKKYDLVSTDASDALKGKRDVYFPKYSDLVPTNIYDMEKLKAGNVIQGPAVIETPITTIIIHPEQTGIVDELLNIIIEF